MAGLCDNSPVDLSDFDVINPAAEVSYGKVAKSDK